MCKNVLSFHHRLIASDRYNVSNCTFVCPYTGWRRETGKFEVDVGSPVDVQ
jgi:hypothetical protein